MSGNFFFRQLDTDLFEATQWTRGPWSPKHQHAGPPSALVAGRLDEALDDSFRIVRVAVEVTRQVPIGRLRLERSLRRDGRSVKAITGKLFDEDGKQLLTMDALAGMAARTEMDARGIGVADTRLYDETGPIGRGVQTLLIRKRG